MVNVSRFLTNCQETKSGRVPRPCKFFVIKARQVIQNTGVRINVPRTANQQNVILVFSKPIKLYISHLLQAQIFCTHVWDHCKLHLLSSEITSVGSMVGSIVGSIVGSMVGSMVGIDVGVAVGVYVGSKVGSSHKKDKCRDVQNISLNNFRFWFGTHKKQI